MYDAQAKQFVDGEVKNYAAAEQLFLSAKKPESAVGMWRTLGRFDDALRVARKDVPRLVAELQREKDLADGQRFEGNTLEALRARAKIKENDKNYSAAIDTYLEVTESHAAGGDLNGVEGAWERAVTLAMEHVHARIPEVVSLVAKRLVKVQRHDQAAELYVSVDDFKAAIDTYVAARMWFKAKELARSDAPHLLNHVLSAEQGESHAVIDDWKVEDKIKQHIDRGEWGQVYELVTPQGEEALSKYASMHAALLVNDSKYREALAVLLKYGLHVIPANFPVYKRLAARLLCWVPGSHERSQSAHPELEVYTGLRELLFKLVSELAILDPQGRDTADFEKTLLIVHLCALKLSCDGSASSGSAASSSSASGLGGVASKIATSLLRYTMDLPVDKAFYDAGMACRSERQNNQAFVFLNRFVDLTDAMADPEDAADIDNSDFLETDIPNPVQVPIPEAAFYPKDVKDEAKEWVIEKAMSNEVNPQLPSRMCDKCTKPTYEAALECHNCHAVSTPCIVTGYPVLKKEKIKCKSCNKEANKSDWNKSEHNNTLTHTHSRSPLPPLSISFPPPTLGSSPLIFVGAEFQARPDSLLFCCPLHLHPTVAMMRHGAHSCFSLLVFVCFVFRYVGKTKCCPWCGNAASPIF